ncbi:hypothetical protein GCM10010954_16340 [Halobacillus andaensis]|uniref:Uncharacterized protein n=1 Tax=Halobacillus andaensis TaxID=1176239 RepID=A0A917B265_HALAA|nr:hypothetical protein [Halobacillus andaensis]MBP2004864.1 hypothetical protein [Halobacillus andaensis]GGF18320.1 hypothetical protein GCM10010954_16340 [Halobacillus andaensis]
MTTKRKILLSSIIVIILVVGVIAAYNFNAEEVVENKYNSDIFHHEKIDDSYTLYLSDNGESFHLHILRKGWRGWMEEKSSTLKKDSGETNYIVSEYLPIEDYHLLWGYKNAEATDQVSVEQSLSKYNDQFDQPNLPFYFVTDEDPSNLEGLEVLTEEEEKVAYPFEK